jgi:hypothetical protein
VINHTRFARILCTLLLCSSSVSFGQCEFLNQKVDLKLKKVTTENCLKQLSDQYNFTVSYASNLFDNQLYNISLKEQTLEDILKSITKKQNVEFVCVGSNSLVFTKRSFTDPFIWSGFVLDSMSKQPVVGALVVHDDNWVETDEDGFFQLKVNDLPIQITMHYPGFKSGWLELSEPTTDPRSYLLAPDNTLELSVIEVYDSLIMVRKTGGVNINISELSKIPSIAGSPGVLNSLRFLPSIQSTLEVNGGMVVQGGGKDQNLVLFDGMELYNPMHLFGLFSVFDENSLQSISFYKNSIPSQYSGRLSSVLDVKSKVGDFQKWNSKLNVNPVLLEGMFHGPIKKGKTSFLLSGRRSFTDFFPLFYEQIQTQNELSRFKYYFYDVTGTLNHKFSDKSHAYLTGYLGGDKGYIRGTSDETQNARVTEDQNDEFVQSNLLLTAGYKTWIGNALSLHVKTGFTQYGFKHENDYDLLIQNKEDVYSRNTRLAYESKISDVKTGIYIKSLPKNHHAFAFGMESIWHNFSPSNSKYFLQENDFIYYDTTFKVRDSKILEQRYFINDVYAKKGLKVMAGLHFVNFDNEVEYRSLQPRLNVSYDIKSRNRIEAGYARTSQFMLFVPNNLLGIPIDIWIPADEHISPMHCEHFLAGYTRKINSNLALKLNGYYKRFENIIEYKNGVADFIAEWDEALLFGKGKSRGIEAMLKKEKGKLNGWLAYTISKSERSIESIDNGAWFPFQFDRRHDMKAVMHYQLNKNLSFGGTWSYASGNYLTAPEVHYLITVENQQYLIEQYGSKNNLKLPAYHRLDIGVHHKKDIGNARQTWSFTIYNVYNRQNVFYVNSSLNSTGSLSFQPVSILPVLPSVNYSIEF